MTRKSVVAISVFSVALLVMVATLSGDDKPGAPKSDVEKKLQAALAERVPVALREFESTRAAYEAETITLDQFIAATRGLKDAELAVAATAAERIKALEGCAERARQTEKRIKPLYEVGLKGGEAVHYAQAQHARLDAEIELYREQLKTE
jgi:hypothetical protein